MIKRVFAVLVVGATALSAAANDILKEAGVTGGLVVQLGCADPAKLMELHASDAFLVHGLDTDSAVVQQARTAIAGKELYGKVSADTWDGKNLPYIDNLVNLLIADAGQVPATEIQRVLAPYGVAMIGGKKVVKPWPANIDSWTHYLHDAGNNAVAHDTVIGPPRHVQWQGGPRWARHHDHVASLNAMVSERGRMFYIMDEGATASALTPSKWRLVARDAFNGIVLWKRDIPDWIPALWPLKSGPANLPRRLVAVGDTVYAPLGFTAPVTAMDATSGKTLRTYAGSDNTEEILVSGDILLALTITKQVVVAEPSPGQLAEAPTTQVRDSRITKSPLINYYWNAVQSPRWFSTHRIVKAYQASTGKQLWEAPASKVMPLSMATDGERVYFHDGEKIMALDCRTGRQAYQTEPVAVRSERMYSSFGPTLVVEDGVIVFAGGEKIGNAWMGWEDTKPDWIGGKQGQDTMTAFDAKTGTKMWTAPHPYGGYQSP
ncbi:MAG: PQQ-like beta-propeller repeat protein, partial [Kiritimatiellales bacterium]|nr:PQQ-like beta-propeller repeat protein [Kiritimatiellales bacterium]